ERWRPVHCFSAHLWMPDGAILAEGFGAHIDATIALSRAITEAVQSRLTTIVGARDDIPPHVYRTPGHRAPVDRSTAATWPEIVKRVEPVDSLTTDAAEATWLIDRLHTVTGQSPLRVDLTRPSELDEFGVVHVQCPGLSSPDAHGIGRGR
ncbi:MAG: YcaO-like family protein, partial [Stackebrandtia sp.]